MKHYNIPIFINHVGCPNSCVFCSQQKINGVETDILPETVKEIIEEYLDYLPKDSWIEVAFFGGTFTGISFDLQRKFLSQVRPYILSGKVKGIRLSTRPDALDDKIVAQLKEYGVIAVELGVQSLDQRVLDLTERNYPVEKVESAVKLLKKWNIEVGIQLMLGLPGSNEEIDFLTAKKAVELNPSMARIYPTLVLKDTELEKMYMKKEYQPYTLEEAVKVGKRVYSLLLLNNIDVIRMGLQPSDDLRADGVIVAGPFHAAFRDLVEGELYFGFLNTFEKELKLDILSNEKNVSKIYGNRGINKEKLNNRIKVAIDNTLTIDEIVVNGVKYNRRDILEIGVK